MEQKRKRGRPRDPADERKCDQINVGLTAAEYARVKARAALVGLSVRAWARLAVDLCARKGWV